LSSSVLAVLVLLFHDFVLRDIIRVKLSERSPAPSLHQVTLAGAM
jgi:hypothetical protein